MYEEDPLGFEKIYLHVLKEKVKMDHIWVTNNHYNNLQEPVLLSSSILDFFFGGIHLGENDA